MTLKPETQASCQPLHCFLSGLKDSETCVEGLSTFFWCLETPGIMSTPTRFFVWSLKTQKTCKLVVSRTLFWCLRP
jgi:hypothetical protein